jgi:U3 small nucleolar RNA-associated protein 12
LRNRHALVSSSKDMLVKVWDLATQHCVQTVVGHRSEVWSIAVNHDETRLITGSAAPSLRLYRVNTAPTSTTNAATSAPTGSTVQQPIVGNEDNSDESEEVPPPLLCVLCVYVYVCVRVSQNGSL